MSCKVSLRIFYENPRCPNLFDSFTKNDHHILAKVRGEMQCKRFSYNTKSKFIDHTHFDQFLFAFVFAN